MASPAQDILDAQRRLSRESIGPVRPDEQAAAGVSAALLRNAPTVQASPYGSGTAPKPGMPGRTVDLKPPAPGGILKRTGRAIAGAPTNAVSGTMSLLRSPTVLGAGGTAVAAVPEALRTGEVLANPRATWNDVGTQAAEGAGRLGAAAAGAAGGMTLGAGLGSVVPGVGTAIGGLAGGALGGLYGYWAGDKAIRGLRGAAGVDTRSPAVQLGAPVEPTRVQQLAGEKPTIASGPAPARPDTPMTTAEPAYSNEGRNYPTATAASELRAPNLDGKIVRDGNSYSGSNIKFGTDIVDPKGNLVNGGDPNKPKGFGVTSFDSSADYQADLRALGRLRAERAEREAGFAANQPGGGLSGISARTLVDDVVAKGTASPLEKAMRDDPSPRRRAQAAQLMATLSQRDREAQMGNAVTLRGQDIGASTAMRGQDIGAGTARRGQDMDYAEKIDARMMDLMARRQLRDAVGQAFMLSKGNPRAAAAYLAANGLDPDNALKMAKYDDERLAAGDKQLDRTVAAQSVDPATGKVVEGAVATNRVAAKKALGTDRATPEQVAAAEPRITSTLKLLNNFNATRDNGFLQALGLEKPSPAYSALPDLRGRSLAETGWFDGAVTPGASAGDFKLTKPGEKPIYLRRDDLDESDLDFLRQNGLRLPAR